MPFSIEGSLWSLSRVRNVIVFTRMFFFATLVALQLTPVSESLGRVLNYRSFETCELVVYSAGWLFAKKIWTKLDVAPVPKSQNKSSMFFSSSLTLEMNEWSWIRLGRTEMFWSKWMKYERPTFRLSKSGPPPSFESIQSKIQKMGFLSLIWLVK